MKRNGSPVRPIGCKRRADARPSTVGQGFNQVFNLPERQLAG